MDNLLFDSKRIANGYANDRPWLHKSVMEQLKTEFGNKIPFDNGLDIGCGAGLSTKALKLICNKVTGTDISAEMIDICKSQYVDTDFIFYAAKAEETKLPRVPYDIVTAAGVVDWVDKDKFLENMELVMAEKAPLILYDFWISDKMLENPAYTTWFQNEYLLKFPKPPRNETRWEQKDIPISFTYDKQISCQMKYEFDLSSFIRFMMTQTNINSKIKNGCMTEEDVHDWMEETLASIFLEQRQILIFDGYIRIYIHNNREAQGILSRTRKELWLETMTKEFIDFLNTIEGASFRAAADDEIAKLKELSNNRLSNDFIEIYSKSVLENKVEYGDIIFYGIGRMYDENIAYVPGINIFPLGLFTFASTFDGDSICIDLNDTKLPVYQCSHELLCDETGISYYKKGEIKTLEFNYKNVIKVSPKLADSLPDFISKLINNSVETYGVTDMIDMLY